MVALTFFKLAKIIEVDSPGTTVTVQDLINQIRDYEDGLDIMDVGRIADASGKDDLGTCPPSFSGITLKLVNDWRVRFECRPGPCTVQVSVTGGNLIACNAFGNNPIAPSTFTQVTIERSTSPTLQIICNNSTCITLLTKIHTNKQEIISNQLIIYDDDDVTPLLTFDLQDASGTPTEDNPKKRIPV